LLGRVVTSSASTCRRDGDQLANTTRGAELARAASSTFGCHGIDPHGEIEICSPPALTTEAR
jgi:hypothetical protein